LVKDQNMNETLGFVHWHWRSGWSLLTVVLVVAIIVILVRLLSSGGSKGGES
jgi:hypothetical protein